MVNATAKYVRVSPRKARQVVDLIRGKSVNEAKAILQLTPRGAAPLVGKVLASAVANAENNNDMVADDLVVVRAYVDEGPTLKRFKPRAMGRATRIRKRTSHITISVDERKES
ncbi:MAG: 50S ribosomal protein L22 [Thermoleophilia bacterium]